MHAEARANLIRCESCKHFRHERFMEVSCEIATGVVSILDATTCPLHGGDVPPADRIESQCVQITVKEKYVVARVFEPVPRDKWPLWAKAIEHMRKPEDIGVGTTWERVLSVVGVAYKATLKAMGMPCNCANRKSAWDVQYAYQNAHPDSLAA